MAMFMAMFKGKNYMINHQQLLSLFVKCRDSWSGQDSDCGVSIFSDYMRPQGHQAV
jgi:hypothetical protein